MREKVGLKVVKALKRNDIGVSHAALDMLCALMQVKNTFIGHTCVVQCTSVELLFLSIPLWNAFITQNCQEPLVYVPNRSGS